MDSNLFGIDLITLHRLIGSNYRLSKIIADVPPPWHCVNTHLNAQDQQTDRISLVEVLTLTDNMSAVVIHLRLYLFTQYVKS